MKYVIIGADGYVRRSGACQDEVVNRITLGPGEQLLRNVSTPISHHTRKVRYANGQFLDDGPVIQSTYITDRKGAYPPVGDQLDMLWHAMNRGELTKVEPFYSQLKAVKDKYPKR